MTETPEKELELECSLCKDIYLEPKTLGCLHSFCLECLETYIERNHATSCLSCPLCRTPFQKQQASNFPTDSFLLHSLNIHNSLSNSISQQKKQKLMCLDEQNEATCYCLDCEIYFCETCATSHKNLKVTINHQIIPIQEMKNQTQINSNSNSRSQLFCQTHQQREMELYCEDCKVPICSLCVLQHAGHKLSAISDIVAKEKQTLMELINQVIFFFFCFLFLISYFFCFFFLFVCVCLFVCLFVCFLFVFLSLYFLSLYFLFHSTLQINK